MRVWSTINCQLQTVRLRSAINNHQFPGQATLKIGRTQQVYCDYSNKSVFDTSTYLKQSQVKVNTACRDMTTHKIIDL